MLITITTAWRFCVNFWVIFGHFGKEILPVFSKDGLNWGKYEMLKIWWIWKIEIWREELVDGPQTVPYQPGALFWGVNCLVVFPAHFNPDNFLLLLLQISLPCRCTPALSGPHVKRTSSIEWTPAWVPKFSSHIYCKINLHLADTSVKRTRTNFDPFCCTIH